MKLFQHVILIIKGKTLFLTLLTIIKFNYVNVLSMSDSCKYLPVHDSIKNDFEIIYKNTDSSSMLNYGRGY